MAKIGRVLPEVFDSLCQAATVKMLASTRRSLPEVFDSLCQAATVKMLASTRRVLPEDVNAQGISNKLCAMDALGASGLRSSTRWAVQMQRRCQTATHRASPTRCTPWLRWAGSCPKSFDSLNYTDAA